jgi:hypothetical protein
VLGKKKKRIAGDPAFFDRAEKAKAAVGENGCRNEL